ncbi:MAG: VWA domain-containing protein, partial [Bdellovibrionales bacterium]|nr:VWA domain-containing protein [Bdellovibrionales bacterium]
TELDIDECVKYQADILSKNTSQVPKLYTTKNKTWLDVEISILFDQSLSTDSWIDNMRICDVIKESLVMMGILFEEILPKISVAGTWSVTRKRCLYNIVKEREDTWDSFYRKVDSIEPQGYTRLGPAIRHINRLMKLSTTSKKILIVLTDGKPSDIDSYEGYHGVQDVKKACMELEEEGVVPIAIVIDRDIKGRFNTMFKNHFIITDPKKLPEQLFSVIKTFIR